MENGRTMAFQISEELFRRIKTYLARETARTGQKLSQRTFAWASLSGRWRRRRPRTPQREVPPTAE